MRALGLARGRASMLLDRLTRATTGVVDLGWQTTVEYISTSQAVTWGWATPRTTGIGR